MLKNLLSITLRSFAKRKFYTLLNILGLASSIAFSFLLKFYTDDQRSYDKHYANAERIYRVNADFNMNGKRDIYSNAPRPIGPTLKSDFPEVEASARLRGMNGLTTHNGILELGEKRVKTTEFFIADSTIFQVFQREFIQGDPDKALVEPNSIVITESLATKLFESEEAFGKSVLLAGFSPRLVTIRGIIKDDDRNSHIPMDAFISWSTFPYGAEMTQWYGAHTYTYILLNQGNDIEGLRSKIPAFVEKYMKKTFDEANGTADLIFQPLTTIHLSKEYVWEPYPHGSQTNVAALDIVIIFLIIFACINYVNLATARASERAAEVGVRKILGSPRQFLILQFLTESILLSLFSGVIALLLCIGLLPYFNMLTDLHLNAKTLLNGTTTAFILILSLSIGIVSGIYPAFYLSSLESLKILKGKFANSARGEALRKLLVTSQYFIAAMLITSILFVAQQTQYIKNKDIGFDKSNIITVAVPADTIVSRHINAYVEELKKQSYIKGATVSFYALDEEANQFTPTMENEDGSTFQMGADLIAVDADFMNAIGIEIVAGRNFSNTSKADESGAILINETAVKKFNWGKNPLAGKYVGGPDREGKIQKLQVVGVVKDFSLGASYKEINPLIIFLNSQGGRTLYARVDSNNLRASIEGMESIWKTQFAGFEFEYNFLDESLGKLYRKEEKFLSLLTAFSFIIVFIASLGILGLISYTTELKKKEIAIRKVLGSPTDSIIVLLSKKFVALIVIANLAAIPASYYLISMWLESFSSRITLSVWPFLISFAICALFTLMSLLYHTIKATSANPVDSLSYD